MQCSAVRGWAVSVYRAQSSRIVASASPTTGLMSVGQLTCHRSDAKHTYVRIMMCVMQPCPSAVRAAASERACWRCGAVRCGAVETPVTHLQYVERRNGRRNALGERGLATAGWPIQQHTSGRRQLQRGPCL